MAPTLRSSAHAMQAVAETLDGTRLPGASLEAELPSCQLRPFKAFRIHPRGNE